MSWRVPFFSWSPRKLAGPFRGSPGHRKQRALCVAQKAVFALDAGFVLALAVYCEGTVNGAVASACEAPCRTPIVFPYAILVFAAHTACVAVKWAVYVRKLSMVEFTKNVAWMEEHRGDALFANTFHAAFTVLLLFLATGEAFCECQNEDTTGELIGVISVFLLLLTGNATLHFAHCERLEWLLHETWQGARERNVETQDSDVAEELHVVHVEELSDYEP